VIARYKSEGFGAENATKDMIIAPVNFNKDGKLHQVNFIGSSEAIDKYSEVIQKIIESVKI